MLSAKIAAKMAGIGKTGKLGNAGEFQVGALQKPGGAPQPLFRQELPGGAAGFLLEELLEIFFREVKMFRQPLHGGGRQIVPAPLFGLRQKRIPCSGGLLKKLPFQLQQNGAAQDFQIATADLVTQTAMENFVKSGNRRRFRREKTDRGTLRDPAEQTFGKFSAKSDVDIAPTGLIRRKKFKTLPG